jgi:hypothetical protein
VFVQHVQHIPVLKTTMIKLFVFVFVGVNLFPTVRHLFLSAFALSKRIAFCTQ